MIKRASQSAVFSNCFSELNDADERGSSSGFVQRWLNAVFPVGPQGIERGGELGLTRREGREDRERGVNI